MAYNRGLGRKNQLYNNWGTRSGLDTSLELEKEEEEEEEAADLLVSQPVWPLEEEEVVVVVADLLVSQPVWPLEEEEVVVGEKSARRFPHYHYYYYCCRRHRSSSQIHHRYCLYRPQIPQTWRKLLLGDACTGLYSVLILHCWTKSLFSSVECDQSVCGAFGERRAVSTPVRRPRAVGLRPPQRRCTTFC